MRQRLTVCSLRSKINLKHKPKFPIMRHECVPQAMTPEQLADWIKSNKVDINNHIEKINLTEDEKAKLAMESSLASRQINKLEELEKYFKTFIKKGTPWDTNVGENGDHRPLTVTIPPTKGLEKLKANRLFADGQIEKGYREEITPVYFGEFLHISNQTYRGRT